MTKKRKNPADATLRNTQASNKKIAALQTTVKYLQRQQKEHFQFFVAELAELVHDIKLLTARAGR